MYENNYYNFLVLDTIKNGIVFGHKYIGIDKCPTDWHIDEIYPGYRVGSSYGAKKGLDGLIDAFDKELYRLNDAERKYLQAEMLKSLNEKRDIIISFRNTDSLSIKDFDRNKIIKSLNGEKFGLEKWDEIQGTQENDNMFGRLFR